MDKYDPNEWTERFVRLNRNFCIRFLLQTNEEVLTFVKGGKYKVAIAGLDRMMNGMIVMHNARLGNFKPFICGLSFIEGDIIACALNDAPDNKRRDIALKAFMDAYDYSTGGLAEFASEAIQLLQQGIDFSDFKNTFDPNFPDESIFGILTTNRTHLSDML